MGYLRPVEPYTIMGVVNVTPDSFSDGGVFEDHIAAIAHARRLAGEGADIIDVGGESTRPGAAPVPAEQELERTIPVVEGVKGLNLPVQISIDTMKVEVARRAIESGASYVNDVTAFRHEPELAALVADTGVDCCLMHMLGEPRTMQENPQYDDVVDDVKAFLHERLTAATNAGIKEERIQLDPGIGFGKTLAHNLELLRRLDELTDPRPAARDRHQPQELPRPHHRPRRDRAGVRDRGHHRDRVRARRPHLPRPRRRRHARRPRGFGCYVRPMARDPDEDFDDEDDLTDDDDDEEGPEVGVTVEIVGLSLYTHHGVTAAEREIGQRLVLDVRFDVGEPDALITDRVEDTVDYGEVCQVIALIAQQRSYKTLERLCAVIADRLASQFGAESVTVKASKPEPPIPLPVEEVSVEVWREER